MKNSQLRDLHTKEKAMIDSLPNMNGKFSIEPDNEWTGIALLYLLNLEADP